MNRNIKTLTGRSMTEMLGVLAIIGVLSIGGVAAYRKAMDTKKNQRHHIRYVTIRHFSCAQKSYLF